MGGGAPALVGLALFGAGRVAGDVLRYTIVHEHTPDLYRGRVAGLWTAQATTGVALGAAVAGGVSSLVSTADTFPVYGGVGALALALPTLRRLVRPARAAA